MELIPGVYETLVSAAIEKKLTALPADKYFVKKVDIDSAESCKMLSDYLKWCARFLRIILENKLHQNKFPRR